jgi:hypothetical protein
MHLSLERLISTVALLSLAVAIVPQLSVAQTTFNEQSSGLIEELLGNLLRVWALDIIVISLSVDHVSLSLSIIPFLCIFPTALIICLADYETFMRIIGLAILTIVFVIARYLANSI